MEMKMKTLLIFLVLAIELSAQAIETRVEPLLGNFVGTNGIKIQVESGGCTHKNSFLVKRRLNAKDQVIQLLFQRVEADTCESYRPTGRALLFSFEELQLERGQSFQIANPLGVHRVPDVLK